MKFAQDLKKPACIWNARKDKPFIFIDGVCETMDEFEIQVLKQAGYQEIKPKRKTRVVKTKEVSKPIVSKPRKTRKVAK